jgi:hypothetical protein
MGGQHHYRSVSTSDESHPLAAEKEGHLRPSGWGKQSILLSIATGTLFVAVIAAVLSTIGSAVISYSGSGSTAVTSTASAAAVGVSTTAAPTPTATPNDDSSKSSDSDADILTPSIIQDCGYSPQQARERGCVFDVMMQLWTPKDCFDSSLSERFLEVGNWTWYADPGAEHVFTLEEMRKGEHDAVYVAQDYHITHCIYAWERLVRAMRTRAPVITELISYDHVIHCRHKTLQRADGGSSIRGVRAPTGYTQCALYDTWKFNLPPNEHSSTD